VEVGQARAATVATVVAVTTLVAVTVTRVVGVAVTWSDMLGTEQVEGKIFEEIDLRCWSEVSRCMSRASARPA
jgi:hypothetical protein